MPALQTVRMLHPRRPGRCKCSLSVHTPLAKGPVPRQMTFYDNF